MQRGHTSQTAPNLAPKFTDCQRSMANNSERAGAEYDGFPSFVKMMANDDEGRNGARGRSRTADTAIFSRMLYQLSYPGTGFARRQDAGRRRAL